MTEQVTNRYETPSVSQTRDIVAAYVANNPVPRSDLAALIVDVHAAIERLRTGAPREAREKLSPSVPIKHSVTGDYIVCLEDGKRFKSLKRHLNRQYGLTPDEYRAKWGLPPTYPMVAPNYSASRSALAKSLGLGLKRVEQKPAPARPKRERTPGLAAAATK